jgi:hypothetical protein
MKNFVLFYWVSFFLLSIGSIQNIQAGHPTWTREKAESFLEDLIPLYESTFKDVEDGCACRADVVSHYLKRKKLKNYKIWVFGRLTPTYLRNQPQFEDDYFWDYHVANLIFTRSLDSEGENSDLESVVIDPVLSKSLMTEAEWMSSLWSGQSVHPMKRVTIEELCHLQSRFVNWDKINQLDRPVYVISSRKTFSPDELCVREKNN